MREPNATLALEVYVHDLPSGHRGDAAALGGLDGVLSGQDARA